MKELLEEKATRYDQAIKVAKSKIKKDKDHVLYEDDIIDIFPELKESEDEKVRKAIINVFASHKDYEVFFGVSVEDILAWLEKQGEKTSDKIVEKARTEKQRVLLTETDGSANIDWDCRSLDDVKILLECGSEFIRTIEANKQILTDSRFGGCSFRVPTRYDKGIKQGEQKPADKKGMNLVEEEMTPFQKKVFCIIDTTIEEEQGLKQVCDELFALASNEIKQKSAAWSEEDESRIDNLCHFLEEYGNQYYGHLTLQGTISWLKSLRPHSRWKPSEEMLEALYRAIPKNTMAISKDEMLLDKLYQGLKYGRVLSKN
jgi:hypothetical protein